MGPGAGPVGLERPLFEHKAKQTMIFFHLDAWGFEDPSGINRLSVLNIKVNQTLQFLCHFAIDCARNNQIFTPNVIVTPPEPGASSRTNIGEDRAVLVGPP